MSHSDEDKQALGVSRTSGVPAPMDDVRATRNPIRRTSKQARDAGIQVYDPFPSEPSESFDDEEHTVAAGEEA